MKIRAATRLAACRPARTCCASCCSVFFFQAEDGIRDVAVTGVQTCALPICTQKTWADGRNFTLVMKDPESPEMHVAVQKLFGVAAGEVKSAIAKLNETRTVVRVVESDEDLLRTVEATPGAVGVLDVYAINSAVKVLRVDGKLPFDTGYALKGN